MRVGVDNAKSVMRHNVIEGDGVPAAFVEFNRNTLYASEPFQISLEQLDITRLELIISW